MRYQEIQLDLSKLCLKISPKLLADHKKQSPSTSSKREKTKTVPQSGKPM